LEIEMRPLYETPFSFSRYFEKSIFNNSYKKLKKVLETLTIFSRENMLQSIDSAVGIVPSAQLKSGGEKIMAIFLRQYQRKMLIKLLRSFKKWAIEFPLTVKCEELGHQLSERTLVLETVRNSYLKDVVSVKYYLDQVDKIDFDEMTKAKWKEAFYDLHSVPSTDVRNVVEKAKRTPHLTSNQLRENLIECGLLDPETYKTLNPWENSRSFRRVCRLEKGPTFNYPTHLNGECIDAFAPSNYKVYVRHCSDCVGMISFVKSWNQKIEEAIQFKVEYASVDTKIEDFKRLISSLQNIVIDKEKEMSVLRENLKAFEDTNAWFVKWKNVQDFQQIKDFYEEKLSNLQNTIYMLLEEKRSMKYEMLQKFDAKTLVHLESEKELNKKISLLQEQILHEISLREKLSMEIQSLVLENLSLKTDTYKFEQMEKELNDKILALNNKIITLEEENTQYNQIITEKDRQFELFQRQMKSQVEDLEQNVKQLELDLDRSETEKIPLKQEIKEKQGILGKQAKEIETLEARIGMLEKELARYKFYRRRTMKTVAIAVLCVVKIFRALKSGDYSALGSLGYRMLAHDRNNRNTILTNDLRSSMLKFRDIYVKHTELTEEKKEMQVIIQDLKNLLNTKQGEYNELWTQFEESQEMVESLRLMLSNANDRINLLREQYEKEKESMKNKFSGEFQAFLDRIKVFGSMQRTLGKKFHNAFAVVKGMIEMMELPLEIKHLYRDIALMNDNVEQQIFAPVMDEVLVEKGKIKKPRKANIGSTSAAVSGGGGGADLPVSPDNEAITPSAISGSLSMPVTPGGTMTTRSSTAMMMMNDSNSNNNLVLSTNLVENGGNLADIRNSALENSQHQRRKSKQMDRASILSNKSNRSKKSRRQSEGSLNTALPLRFTTQETTIKKNYKALFRNYCNRFINSIKVVKNEFPYSVKTDLTYWMIWIRFGKSPKDKFEAFKAYQQRKRIENGEIPMEGEQGKTEVVAEAEQQKPQEEVKKKDVSELSAEELLKLALEEKLHKESVPELTIQSMYEKDSSVIQNLAGVLMNDMSVIQALFCHMKSHLTYYKQQMVYMRDLEVEYQELLKKCKKMESSMEQNTLLKNKRQQMMKARASNAHLLGKDVGSYLNNVVAAIDAVKEQFGTLYDGNSVAPSTRESPFKSATVEDQLLEGEENDGDNNTRSSPKSKRKNNRSSLASQKSGQSYSSKRSQQGKQQQQQQALSSPSAQSRKNIRMKHLPEEEPAFFGTIQEDHHEGHHEEEPVENEETIQTKPSQKNLRTPPELKNLVLNDEDQKSVVSGKTGGTTKKKKKAKKSPNSSTSTPPSPVPVSPNRRSPVNDIFSVNHSIEDTETDNHSNHQNSERAYEERLPEEEEQIDNLPVVRSKSNKKVTMEEEVSEEVEEEGVKKEGILSPSPSKKGKSVTLPEETEKEIQQRERSNNNNNPRSSFASNKSSARHDDDQHSLRPEAMNAATMDQQQEEEDQNPDSGHPLERMKTKSQSHSHNTLSSFEEAGEREEQEDNGSNGEENMKTVSSATVSLLTTARTHQPGDLSREGTFTSLGPLTGRTAVVSVDATNKSEKTNGGRTVRVTSNSFTYSTAGGGAGGGGGGGSSSTRTSFTNPAARRSTSLMIREQQQLPEEMEDLEDDEEYFDEEEYDEEEEEDEEESEEDKEQEENNFMNELDLQREEALAFMQREGELQTQINSLTEEKTDLLEHIQYLNDQLAYYNNSNGGMTQEITNLKRDIALLSEGYEKCRDENDLLREIVQNEYKYHHEKVNNLLEHLQESITKKEKEKALQRRMNKRSSGTQIACSICAVQEFNDPKRKQINSTGWDDDETIGEIHEKMAKILGDDKILIPTRFKKEKDRVQLAGEEGMPERTFEELEEYEFLEDNRPFVEKVLFALPKKSKYSVAGSHSNSKRPTSSSKRPPTSTTTGVNTNNPVHPDEKERTATTSNANAGTIYFKETNPLLKNNKSFTNDNNNPAKKRNSNLRPPVSGVEVIQQAHQQFQDEDDPQDNDDYYDDKPTGGFDQTTNVVQYEKSKNLLKYARALMTATPDPHLATNLSIVQGSGGRPKSATGLSSSGHPSLVIDLKLPSPTLTTINVNNTNNNNNNNYMNNTQMNSFYTGTVTPFLQTPSGSPKNFTATGTIMNNNNNNNNSFNHKHTGNSRSRPSSASAIHRSNNNKEELESSKFRKIKQFPAGGPLPPPSSLSSSLPMNKKKEQVLISNTAAFLQENQLYDRHIANQYANEYFRQDEDDNVIYNKVNNPVLRSDFIHSYSEAALNSQPQPQQQSIQRGTKQRPSSSSPGRSQVNYDKAMSLMNEGQNQRSKQLQKASEKILFDS
jgi:hypothetical protein